jgi:excisionase family DNA binding protein
MAQESPQFAGQSAKPMRELTAKELKSLLAEARKSLDQMYQHHYVRPSTFAEQWGVSASTVRRWVAAGHIPAVRSPGGRMLIPWREAESRIAQNATITWRRKGSRKAAASRVRKHDPTNGPARLSPTALRRSA